MSETLSELFKSKYGFDLDEIYEGYTFKGKNEHNFIFKSDIEYISKTIDQLKIAISEKVKSNLTASLEELGIFYDNFNLINFYNQQTSLHRIIGFDKEKGLVHLEDGTKTRRTVHITLLQNEQTKYLINELREVEYSFNKFDLKCVLREIQTICEKVFHPSNESNLRNDIQPTLLRIKVKILEKLNSEDINISELNMNELEALKAELDFSKSLVDISNTRLLKAFDYQILRIENKISSFMNAREIDEFNHENFLEIFLIDKIKSSLLTKLETTDDKTILFNKKYEIIKRNIELKSGLSFRKLDSNINNIAEFIEKLYDLQNRYINSQLKIGKHDTLLISRFEVEAIDNRDYFSILENFEGITNIERFNLHKELVEHRLNLLFHNNIHDQHFKDL